MTSSKDKVHGEGNYEAAKTYNDATKKFVESGRVEQAARDAAPKTAAEATEMKQAEQAALLHARVAPVLPESQPGTHSHASHDTLKPRAKASKGLA